MKSKTKYLILLATTTGLNAVENEMPKSIKTAYNAKISETD